MLIFPLINDTSRKIIHIDMDAFFAAVEERDNPKLKGKPLVIGADPRQTGGRGVVSTANYLAREFGIHSAMSSKEAYERCPQAIFIRGNHTKYRQIGLQVREIFRRYTDLVEPMSIDEAYLDVTENKLNIKSAVKIAKLIQRDIWEEFHLT
jgi:DNA polymerase-4